MNVPNRMIKYILGSIVASLLWCGCTTAFKTVAVTHETVVFAMHLYDAEVKAGKITLEQQKKVRAAYSGYVAAMLVAADAGHEYALSQGKNETSLKLAVDAVISNRKDLLALLKSFGVNINIR